MNKIISRNSNTRGKYSTDDLVLASALLYTISVMIFDYTWVYQVALALMLVCILLFDRGWTRIKITPVVYMYGALLIYFLLHTLCGFSQALPESVSRLMTMATSFVGIACVAYIIQSKNAYGLVMKTVVFSAVFFVVYTVLTLRADIWNDLAWNTIPRFLFSNQMYLHNDIPIVFALAIFFLRYYLVKSESTPPMRFAIWLFIGILLMLVVLSGARKGLICVLFALVIFPVMLVGNKKSFMMKTLLIVLITIIAYVACVNIEALYSSIGYRLEAVVQGFLTGDYSGESSARYRDLLSDYAWAAISENWLAGYGLNTFGALSGFGGWTENTYLDIWYSGGIIPVLIFLSFFMYAIVQLVKKTDNRVETMLYLSLTVWFVVNSVLTVSYVSRSLAIVACMISAFLSSTQNGGNKANVSVSVPNGWVGSIVPGKEMV